MGFYNDVAINSQTIKQTPPRVGLDRSAAEQLQKKDVIAGEVSRPPQYGAQDDIQTIPEQTSSGVGDTYTLTFNYPRLAVGTFTTAAIAYDATAATVVTAIDVAATSAGVTGWTNGDITVVESGAAGLSDGTLTITGTNSVGNEPASQLVMTPTGWTQDGTIARTQGGQIKRAALASLFESNTISGTLNVCGVAPTDWVIPATMGQQKFRSAALKKIAWQTMYDNGTSEEYDAILALYPILSQV